ncbi:hypothetical protein AURDEDRAFT_85252 [Auricularia subglabra TFB-10046 SS5]|nr:hypothetical protein AURDEDRAFT_85252 [Auricularia subglabra TFB-10046 SS5]
MRPRVFFDLALGDQQPARVIFELYNDIVPDTAENFRALATGEKGLSPLSQVPLYYKNSIIHRAIKGFMVQGGDFTKRNGSGGESIYGGPFPDEDLSQPLDSEGLLVMANKGPNTNGSQWFVTLRACPHLDGKHVVFGRVLKGYDAIAAVADVPTDEKDRPLQPVVIVNCGELVRKAAPPQPERSRKRSASVSRSASPEERDRRKRSRRSSGPGEDEDDRADSGDDRKHRKKKHHHHKKHSSKQRHRSKSPSRGKEQERDEPSRAKEPRQETEEEYDARLEREEKERLEASRRYHMAEMKRRYEREQRPSSNGIIYKGRGEMRFRD